MAQPSGTVGAGELDGMNRIEGIHDHPSYPAHPVDPV
jgi:hypothetical protein